MWNHIVNIHPSELLRTKPKNLELKNTRKFKNLKKIDDLHVIPNNILIRLFKELNIYIYI